jgi:hypothetical protein
VSADSPSAVPAGTVARTFVVVVAAKAARDTGRDDLVEVSPSPDLAMVGESEVVRSDVVKGHRQHVRSRAMDQCRCPYLLMNVILMDRSGREAVWAEGGGSEAK